MPGREVMIDAFAAHATDEEIRHFVRKIGTDRMRRLTQEVSATHFEDSAVRRILPEQEGGMNELRISFPDGLERVLFRSHDELGLALLVNSMLGLFEHVVDEERFQIGLVKEEDGEIMEGAIVCHDGRVREIRWTKSSKPSLRDDRKEEIRARLDRLADLLLAAKNMHPDTIETLRRLVDGAEPEMPLKQGNRTIIDKLRQRHPELEGVRILSSRVCMPTDVDDLSMFSVSVETQEFGWKDYRLEIVA